MKWELPKPDMGATKTTAIPSHDSDWLITGVFKKGSDNPHYPW